MSKRNSFGLTGGGAGDGCSVREFAGVVATAAVVVTGSDGGGCDGGGMGSCAVSSAFAAASVDGCDVGAAFDDAGGSTRYNAEVPHTKRDHNCDKLHSSHALSKLMLMDEREGGREGGRKWVRKEGGWCQGHHWVGAWELHGLTKFSQVNGRGSQRGLD